MLFQRIDQSLRCARGVMPPEEIVIAGQYQIDAGQVARCRNLRVLERQEFVTECGGKNFLGQGQDSQKSHELHRESPFAQVSAGSGDRTMVADHAEGRRTNIAHDGVGFGEGQGARRRVRVGSLEEDIEKNVRIEQHAQSLAGPNPVEGVRLHRVASLLSFPIPET